jgi:hypothetical protein
MTDPIVIALEECCKSLNIQFIYGNRNEVNLGLDSLTVSYFPAMIYIAQESDVARNAILDSGLKIRTQPILLALMTSKESPTNEYTTREIEAEVEPMRILADKIIRYINVLYLTYELQPVREYRVNKLYQKFDFHLFGVGLSFDWSIKETVPC